MEKWQKKIIKDLDMEKAGFLYKCRCPFHKERTPSFMISIPKEVYHCYGCGKGGPLVKLVGITSPYNSEKK